MTGVVDVLHFTLAVTVSNAGWKLDSGATQHIVNSTADFTSFTSYGTPKILQVGKAAVYLRAVGEGTMLLQVPSRPSAGVTGGTSDFILTKVWLCPECPFCLISTRRIVENGYSIKLDKEGATILLQDDTPAIWMPLEESGLYTCRPVNRPAIDMAAAVAEQSGVTKLFKVMIFLCCTIQSVHCAWLGYISRTLISALALASVLVAAHCSSQEP
jgi:hypothetical protein